MMNKHYKSIMSDTYTTDDYYKRIRLLRNYLEDFYYNKNKTKPPSMSSNVDSKLPDTNISDEDQTALETWLIKLSKNISRRDYYKTIENLKQQVKVFPVVRVYIAYTPSEKNKKSICEWLRKEINSHLLMDIESKPELIGGCAISWKGYYRDFSVKAQLEREHEKIREIINEQLNNGTMSERSEH